LWSKSSLKLLAVLTLCSAFVFHLRASQSELLIPLGLLFTFSAGAYSFWRISTSFRTPRVKTP
jgi:hypothetical protein